MPAGDALLGDGCLQLADGGGEDVGLLQDLRGQGPVQGAEGCAVVLLRPLIQLQHRELVPTGLSVPVLILGDRERKDKTTGLIDYYHIIIIPLLGMHKTDIPIL